MLPNSFWITLNILTETQRNPEQIKEDVQNWVDKVINANKDDTKTLKYIVKDEIKGHSSDKIERIREDSEDGVQKKFMELTKKIPKVQCSFCHPHVRSKLVNLMGSNVVNLTDREYMQKLQQRIIDDYSNSMTNRIKEREREELNRVKNLVLGGIIPLDKAPSEMADHPVLLIDNTVKKRKRNNGNRRKSHFPQQFDNNCDTQSQLSISTGGSTNKNINGNDNDNGDVSEGKLFPFTGIFSSDYTDNEHLIVPKEYNKLNYESPLIKELKSAQTVEELYQLADQIIGIIKSYAKEINRLKSPRSMSECSN